jgi:TolB protein
MQRLAFCIVLIFLAAAGRLSRLSAQDRDTIPTRDQADTTRPRRELFFSVKTWEGDYASQDVPGGVATTPVVGAIYSVKDDGTGLKKVVALGKNTDYPTVSPDGQWLYFQSNATGHSQVYRCRLDGSGVTNLTISDPLGKPWKDAFGYFLSANGTKLLYTVHDGSTGRVALANADGSDPRLITPELGYTYMAALSPDNASVVFSGPARGYRLLLVRLPDGKPLELTPEQGECFVPQFTPDGKTVVFLRRDGDVYRVGTDGHNLRRLTHGNRHVEFRLSAQDRHGSTDGPHISPDGKRIAYVAVRYGIANVCVMNLDGTEQRQLTFRKAPCGRVRWSPDGNAVAFVSFVGKYTQLFVVAANGGEPRQLTRMEGAVYFVNWKPGLGWKRSSATSLPRKRRAAHAVLVQAHTHPICAPPGVVMCLRAAGGHAAPSPPCGVGANRVA